MIANSSFDGQVGAIAWFRDRWVAIGQAGEGGPTAWWSTDGVAWQREQLLLPSPGPDPFSNAIVSLAVREDVLVAVGYTKAEISSSSIDIGSVALGPLAGSDRAFAGALAPGPRLAATCYPVLVSADALVITSSDGQHWSAVPDSAVLHGQPMLGVAVRPDGLFVAAGGADASNRSASWTSKDGRSWTRAPDSEALRAGVITTVVAMGTTILAAGFHRSEPFACPESDLWRSKDGLRWSVVAKDASVGTEALGRPLAANTSRALSLADPYGARALTTIDGETWSWLQMPADGPTGPLAALPDGFVASGSESLWFTTDGTGWTSMSPPRQGSYKLGVSPDAIIAIGGDIWLGRLPTAR